MHLWSQLHVVLQFGLSDLLHANVSVTSNLEGFWRRKDDAKRDKKQLKRENRKSLKVKTTYIKCAMVPNGSKSKNNKRKTLQGTTIYRFSSKFFVLCLIVYILNFSLKLVHLLYSSVLDYGNDFEIRELNNHQTYSEESQTKHSFHHAQH